VDNVVEEQMGYLQNVWVKRIMYKLAIFYCNFDLQCLVNRWKIFLMKTSTVRLADCEFLYLLDEQFIC